ncbi:unnamed protein product, partial [Pelagomonas calceolata]
QSSKARSTCKDEARLMAADPQKRVLVLGGTQFIGVHIVRELLKQGYEVTLLNRGVTPSPFEGDPRVGAIHADRFEDREAVSEAIASEEWSGVVDTTCFDVVDASTVVDAIASLETPPRCVYISTDSVFAACERVQKDSLVEADAVRATSRQAIAELKRRDSYQYGYGSAKLDAEEVYATIDSVSLRLPDVIGPRDNLGGFLDLIDAVGRGRVGSAVKHVADGKPHVGSIAYAPDVGRAVVAALTASNPPKVLHIACVQPVSVAELAALVAAGRDYALDAARKAPLLTVDVGGPICVDAALSALDWRPTPLADAIRETVAWYETAEHRNYTRALAAGKTPAA